MCSHCLNALSGLRKCFLKEIFIPRHMLNTHSSHFVALHFNFFFAATYVFYVPIKAMCGTREALDMGILVSDQGETPFARPVHHHREDVG
jgi:hypothetical protein